MPLSSFVDGVRENHRSLVVINRAAPQPVLDLLEELFDGQPVEITEEDIATAPADAVFLLDENGVIASSTLDSIMDAILLVNSDLYITGARKPHELELPDILRELDDIRFTLRGYPESNKEKLLLITISRYIEGLAIEADNGKLRASFQELSRINDERGTRWVYETLADSAVDTHVYGIPDWLPPSTMDLTIHSGWSPDFTDTWFVTFVPEEGSGTFASLIAIERAPRVWEGFWTYDEDTVTEINRYIEREL